jgi:hypothetical protein
MGSELVPTSSDAGIPGAAAIGAPELADRAAALLLAAESPNTIRSYRAGWASQEIRPGRSEHGALALCGDRRGAPGGRPRVADRRCRDRALEARDAPHARQAD